MTEVSLCGRVGCGEPAATVLLMAPQDTQAWLVGLDHVSAREGVALCPAHADRISVPLGWSLTDNRAPAKAKRKRRKKSVGSVPDPVDEGYIEPERQFLGDPDPEDPQLGSQSTEHSVASSAAEAHHPSVAPGADGGTDGAAAHSPRLSVVAGEDDPDSTAQDGRPDFDDDGQGALWADPADREPDETTPLLKRAFRVVRDE